MTTAQDVLAMAAGEVGYVESGGRDGRSGNWTKYWRELEPAMQGQPWCGGYVSWVFKTAGAPLPAIDKPYGFVGVYAAVDYARKHGLAHSEGQPGDIALYSYGKGHCGIYERPAPSGGFYAFEGNTSPSDDTNGGMVMRRLRTSGVICFMRVPLSASSAPYHTEAHGVRIDTKFYAAPGRLDRDGHGYLDVDMAFEKITGVIVQGSNPAKEGYWPPVICEGQPMGGVSRFDLYGSPGQTTGIFVRYLTD